MNPTFLTQPFYTGTGESWNYIIYHFVLHDCVHASLSTGWFLLFKTTHDHLYCKISHSLSWCFFHIAVNIYLVIFSLFVTLTPHTDLKKKNQQIFLTYWVYSAQFLRHNKFSINSKAERAGVRAEMENICLVVK